MMQPRHSLPWRQIRERLLQAPPSWLDQVLQWGRPVQSEPAAATPEEPRRIGLALGGGGGKGGAHLGVLAVMEELGVPIDILVGTSIGGAVGVLYAAGLSTEQISSVFRASALRRIATVDPTNTGLIGERKRIALLTSVLGDKTFADLRIPCAVVATDLASGQVVVIDEGPLVPALLATTALPGIFPPVARDGALLADGGILNNLPVDVAEAMGATRVIGVQLVSEDEAFTLPVGVPESPLSRLMLAPRQFAIANRALGLMIAQASNVQLSKHPPALLLEPDVVQIATLDMAHLDDGRLAGEAVARGVADDLVRLRDWRTAAPETAQLLPSSVSQQHSYQTLT